MQEHTHTYIHTNMHEVLFLLILAFSPVTKHPKLGSSYLLLLATLFFTDNTVGKEPHLSSPQHLRQPFRSTLDKTHPSLSPPFPLLFFFPPPPSPRQFHSFHPTQLNSTYAHLTTHFHSPPPPPPLHPNRSCVCVWCLLGNTPFTPTTSTLGTHTLRCDGRSALCLKLLLPPRRNADP